MMAIRDDAVGMFWADLGREKPTPTKIPRTLPSTPDTGWRPPTSLPNLLAAKEPICVDVETKDPTLQELGPGVRRGAHIVGLAVGVGNQQWYFPIRHEVGTEYNLDSTVVMAWAREQLAGPQDKVGANLLYDADFLAEAGVRLGGRWMDVQIAEPLLDENRFTYNLQALGEKYLGEGKTKNELEEWVFRAYRNKNYRAEIWRTSPILVGPYAQGDVDLPLRILNAQLPAIEEQGLSKLWRIESGLLPLLLAMRRGGVRIDLVKRQRIEDQLHQEIIKQQKQLDVGGGFPVNINAAASLQRLFDKSGISYPRTSNGRASFAKDWMEHHPHPTCKAIVQLRQLTKLHQLVIGLREHLVGDRIHTLFHPTKTDEHGTVSGRFASSSPNLQNVAARDPYWGPLIRSIFIPEDGQQWIRHDWSQIEYRFLAHFAVGKAAKMVQRMYNEDPDTDFHVMVAELTGLDRKAAKNTNFALVYGQGPPALARRLEMSIEQAQREVFDIYHERAPFVKDTYNRASQRAQIRGYIKTILGRRARFEMWEHRDHRDSPLPHAAARLKYGDGIRRAFTHKALNRLLQGSAADLMKKAMLDIWEAGIYSSIPVALLTVHDELDHSAPITKEAQQAVAEIKRIMETAIALRVPVIAQEERGPNWGELVA